MGKALSSHYPPMVFPSVCSLAPAPVSWTDFRLAMYSAAKQFLPSSQVFPHQTDLRRVEQVDFLILLGLPRWLWAHPDKKGGFPGLLLLQCPPPASQALLISYFWKLGQVEQLLLPQLLQMPLQPPEPSPLPPLPPP